MMLGALPQRMAGADRAGRRRGKTLELMEKKSRIC
jgi:hypothetical protein